MLDERGECKGTSGHSALSLQVKAPVVRWHNFEVSSSTLRWSTLHTRWLADICGSLIQAAFEHLLLAGTLPFELWQVVGTHCFWVG